MRQTNANELDERQKSVALALFILPNQRESADVGDVWVSVRFFIEVNWLKPY